MTMPEVLTFTVTDGPDHGVVVHPRGVIGLAGAAELEAALTAYARHGRPHITIELSQVPLIDSAGMTALLRVNREATAHSGWLRLACAPDRVRRVFDMTNLGEIIQLHPSVADAIAAP